jgi:hypothetical protein
LRRQLDHERWVNREVRQERVFTPYYPRPVVVYQDPYSSFFWWWLLDQTLDQRAWWAYHHRDVMDQARYRDLLAKDAQLEARIRDLEAKGVQRDPAFTPNSIDPDLMYTKEYVEAAYNPQVVTVPKTTENAANSQPARAKAPLRSALGVVVTVLAVAVFLAFVVWLVFFKRWGI